MLLSGATEKCSLFLVSSKSWSRVRIPVTPQLWRFPEPHYARLAKEAISLVTRAAVCTLACYWRVSRHLGAGHVPVLSSALFCHRASLSSLVVPWHILWLFFPSVSTARPLAARYLSATLIPPGDPSACPWRRSLRKCFRTALKSELSALFCSQRPWRTTPETSGLVVTISAKRKRHHGLLSDHGRDPINGSGSQPNVISPWIFATGKKISGNMFFFSFRTTNDSVVQAGQNWSRKVKWVSN